MELGWSWDAVLPALVSSSAVFTLGGFLLKHILTRKIDSHFNIRMEDHKNILSNQLETHKQQLNVLTETAKYDLQRKMHDFSLNRQKSHEIYLEIYKYAVTISQKIEELKKEWGVQFIKTLPENEFKNYLKNRNVDDDRIDDLFQKRENPFFINDVQFWIKKNELDVIKQEYQKGHSIFLSSRFYLSDDAEWLLGELFKLYGKQINNWGNAILWRTATSNWYGDQKKKTEMSIQNNEKTIDDLMKKIKIQIKAELSIAEG